MCVCACAVLVFPAGNGDVRAVAYTDDPVDIKPDCVLAADWSARIADVFQQSEVVVRMAAV